MKNMCCSNSTHLIIVFVAPLGVAFFFFFFAIRSTVYTSEVSSKFLSLIWATFESLPLSFFFLCASQCHFSMATGDGAAPPRPCPNKPSPPLLYSLHSLNLIIFLNTTPLSDDTTATAAHYSGQPFGLLKDVMLSGLPFKAGFIYYLSRLCKKKNNAEDHCGDAWRQSFFRFFSFFASIEFCYL